ncbi:MAG: hypothetical protein A3F46_05565 [Legionellales bacterium RIFCSPHIGHO2_12_FULL_42_9]|nr:MAG: hypothetical protein A3F46_05565 [Legionellales bacterium RIFCSPHIGHO2_12_FULL_42_9]
MVIYHLLKRTYPPPEVIFNETEFRDKIDILLKRSFESDKAPQPNIGKGFCKNVQKLPGIAAWDFRVFTLSLAMSYSVRRYKDLSRQRM